MQPYDRSSKWLLDHHGASVLRLAGVTDVVSCRTVQPEVVQPRQTPDGLLEVRFAGRNDPDYFLIEIATDPQRRVSEQVLRDVLLVYLDRRAVPEVITLVLRPKGTYQVPGVHTLASRLNLTRFQVSWHVVELWNLPATDLLAANDVGLVPWVPLAHYEGPPEPILQECRRRIDEQANPTERANLLAVIQVLMRMWYNEPQLFAIFGGQQAMIESPLIQEIIAQRFHKVILRRLEARFGTVPSDLATELRAVTDDDQLDALIDWATQAPDLQAFRARLATGPQPS